MIQSLFGLFTSKYVDIETSLYSYCDVCVLSNSFIIDIVWLDDNNNNDNSVFHPCRFYKMVNHKGCTLGKKSDMGNTFRGIIIMFASAFEGVGEGKVLW